MSDAGLALMMTIYHTCNCIITVDLQYLFIRTHFPYKAISYYEHTFASCSHIEWTVWLWLSWGRGSTDKHHRVQTEAAYDHLTICWSWHQTPLCKPWEWMQKHLQTRSVEAHSSLDESQCRLGRINKNTLCNKLCSDGSYIPKIQKVWVTAELLILVHFSVPLRLYQKSEIKSDSWRYFEVSGYTENHA